MPTTERGEHGRIRLLVAGLVVLAAATGVLVLVRHGVGPFREPEGCSAHVGGVTVDLSTPQAENAALIAAISVRRGLPARAASIALAAAFQESKLTNLSSGDLDSVGLFQQRPSQGWGTRAQILDTHYAINAFYDALVKVNGYENLPITVAAQQVQRSGYPDAYAQHEAGARALASALTGWSPGKFSCVAYSTSGTAPGPDRVRADLQAAFGPLPVRSTGPRSLQVVMTPPDADHVRLGWAVAAYLVAQARRLHVDRVAFDGRVWTAGRASQSGWQPDRPKGSASTVPLGQRDQVSVTLGTGAGTPGSN